MCRQGPVIFWFEGITGSINRKARPPCNRFLGWTRCAAARLGKAPPLNVVRRGLRNRVFSEAWSRFHPSRMSGGAPDDVGGFPLTRGPASIAAPFLGRFLRGVRATPHGRVAGSYCARQFVSVFSGPAEGVTERGARVGSRRPCHRDGGLVCSCMPNVLLALASIGESGLTFD